jgi:hypothetical protein
MKKLIYFLFAITLIAGALIFESCSKNDTLPKIDGFNNSNEVSSSNLVAHWTFDDTKNEVISSTAPTNSYGTSAFVTGQIGKALQLTEGALVFPSIANIGAANSLGNYTVSMWVNVKNNGHAFSTFFGIFPTADADFWGNLSLSAETSWFPADGPVGDTLVLKTNYQSLNDDLSLNSQDNRPDPRGTDHIGVFKNSGVWCHFVARFDATTHKLQIFGNGTAIGAYDNRGDNTVALNMRVPCQVIIGSLATSEIGFASAPARPDWQVLATASLDDIRVFKTTLTDSEITALYNLGSAGR